MANSAVHTVNRIAQAAIACVLAACSAASAQGQVVFEVIESFELSTSSGANPSGGLIQASDGDFYGTTFSGGASNLGTVFKIDAAGTLTTLHSFSGGDGAGPVTKVVQAFDGSFYGTTSQGGASNLGTIFRIDAAGHLTTIHSFTGSDGQSPGELIQATDGNFYGTMAAVGSPFGIVFRVDGSGSVTTLHRFTLTDGAYPSRLVQATDGNFYGTTVSGGNGNNGTVFKIDMAGNLATLHSFSSDGSGPAAGVIQAADGDFYGTTSGYDTESAGTVFKMDMAGSVTTLHRFYVVDGAQPFTPLIQASDGSFYGTTSINGHGGGTVFKITGSGAIRTLHYFAGSSIYPSGLIEAGDGRFYGTTNSGGLHGAGVVFRITVNRVTRTTLTASPNPSAPGQAVSLLATVGADAAIPTGVVEFFDGSTSLGAGTLVDGTVSLEVSSLSPGSHVLRARYAGEGRYDPSASPVVTQNVISPTNHAPVAFGQLRWTREDRDLSIALKATDRDSDPLAFTLVAPPVHGTLNGLAPDVTYTPAANYNGPDSFTFKANDGRLDSNVATVRITVTAANDAPISQNGTAETTVGTAVSGALVATDSDGQVLTYSIVRNGFKGAASIDPSTGAYIYTPNDGASGQDTFTFRANDGTANSNTATVRVTIAASMPLEEGRVTR